MTKIYRFGGLASAGLLMIAGLSACSVGGGDGTVKFGTGLDSDHNVTGETSTFAASASLFSYSASLKDTVPGNTIHEQVIGPKGNKIVDVLMSTKSDDVNHAYQSGVSVQGLVAKAGPGRYTLQFVSGGKTEASGAVTFGAPTTSSQTSSQASS